MKEFFHKNKLNIQFWITCFIVIFCFFTACGIVINEASKPINEQMKHELYDKEKLLATDFANLEQLENVELKITDSTYRVKFLSDECELVTVYDKEHNVLTKELIDVRTFNSSLLACIYFVLVVGLLCPLALSYFLVFHVFDGLCFLVRFIINKVRNRKITRR